MAEAELSLFAERERTRQEPLKRGEQLFEFYDSCARDGYDQLRVLLNGWIAAIPEEHRAELVSRMQYGGDEAFGAALCELLVASFLTKSGLKLVFHPDVPGSTNHPDFAVVDEAGKTICYVEVTTVNRAAERAKEQNREAVIYNAIDGAKLPAGCLLGYNLVRAGPSSPATKPLVAAIEQWARDNVEQARTAEMVGRFTAGEWIIEMELYAGGEPGQRGHAIGVASLGGGIIHPHKDIRAALVKKSRRYGKLDAPYVIVVGDGKDQLFSAETVRIALTEAVFGDEKAAMVGGKLRLDYAKNGFWNGPNGPQNQHVSGVLLLPKHTAWHLREEKWHPLLAVNPWATSALSAELKTLPCLENDNGRWSRHDGVNFADILGVPNPWPPE
ncbi:hypothetical protein [Bradyrhizobium manausense]|uniref:Uncharacterized protein n=1 Tax=Bradyrhizobium manausense TaxID=989370 RepID=A0A0R3DPB2_9BRAD|nr:hypothetical protein [Bradyrhizobium manausense]KRQ09154.1 hypothetical protein AOQ71_21225 [Bradyrhizobium manausense]